jgi:hypothetical protein
MSPTVPVFPGTVSNPYPQYTTCVEAADYDPENQYVQMAIAGIFAGGIAFIIAGATTATPWCYLAAAGITLIAAGLAYCNWWLTDRLICLPVDVNATTGPAVDVCAVGMFVSEDQTDPTAWPFDLPDLDTDWTMDLVLFGTEPSDTSVNILIGETDAISSLGLGFENGGQGETASYILSGTYDGSSAAYLNGGVTITSPVLHCEVEGAGVADYQNWLQACFWIAVGALVAQVAVAVIPVIGPILSAILALLAWLLSLVGFYASETDHPSQPVSPGDQPLTFNPPGQASGTPASVVGVIGTWVYDSAHEGWNEIHPVKTIQAVGTMSPSLAGYSWDSSWAAYCGLMNEAGSATTTAGQREPSNGWIIHPLLDGCGTYPLPPVTQPPPIQ